jgi:hypothetical protein
MNVARRRLLMLRFFLDRRAASPLAPTIIARKGIHQRKFCRDVVGEKVRERGARVARHGGRIHGC